MRIILLLGALVAFCASCTQLEPNIKVNHDDSSDKQMDTAPKDSVVMYMTKSGEIDDKGMAKVNLTFKNVSKRDVYFPVRFRGGVTYIKEIIQEPEEVEEIDENGDVNLIEEKVMMPRYTVRRGCGGQAGRTKDDFILLAPDEVHSTTVSINVSEVKTPFTLQLSRAIYSSDIKLPNMWLGNTKSNELEYRQKTICQQKNAPDKK